MSIDMSLCALRVLMKQEVENYVLKNKICLKFLFLFVVEVDCGKKNKGFWGNLRLQEVYAFRV